MNRFVLFLCLLAGCSGGVSADQACSDSATASCAKLDSCRANGVALRYGNMATCVARVKANCLAAVGAPDTGRTPANQEACGTAYAGASCSDYLENTITACQAPAGIRAQGRSCAFSAQCQSAFCAFATGAACGTCTSPPTNGQSCQQTQCGSGQVCSAATTTCEPYGGPGDSCSGSNECQTGYACVIPTVGMRGTCQQGGAVLSATCDHKAGPNCDYLKGLYCSVPPNATAGTCVNFLYAGAGQACGYTPGMGTTGGSYTDCNGGSSCIIPAGKSAGTCMAYATEGKACDSAAGPACLSPARCVVSGQGTAGTCQLADPLKCS